MNNDLISRSALKKTIEEVQYTQEFCIEHKIDYSVSMQMLGMVIDNAPTVEAYPFEQVQELVNLNQQFAQEIENLKRPKGEWITRTKDNGVNYHFYCSCCDREVIQITDYCPNCGADMRVKDELKEDKDNE